MTPPSGPDAAYTAPSGGASRTTSPSQPHVVASVPGNAMPAASRTVLRVPSQPTRWAARRVYGPSG